MSFTKRQRFGVLFGFLLLIAGGVTFFLRSVLYTGILSLFSAGAGVLLLFLIFLKVKASLKVYRTVSRILFILLALFLLTFLIAEGFVITAAVQGNRRESAAQNDFTHVIVPGAGLFRDTGRPSLLFALRLRRAAELYRADPSLTIVVCGGQGNDEIMPEAAAGRDYLLSLGLPPEAVAAEEESLDTAENFRNFAELYPDVRRCAVVSNDFHLFRCSLLAKRYGLDPVCFSSPTPKLSLKLNYFAREYVSLAIYLVESGGYIIDTSNFHL